MLFYPAFALTFGTYAYYCTPGACRLHVSIGLGLVPDVREFEFGLAWCCAFSNSGDL